MRKALGLVILLTLLAALAAASGCNRAGGSLNGSGKIISEEIKVKDFTKVEVEGAFTVEIVRADQFEVSISTDDNLFTRVLVSREEQTLKLSISAPATFFPTSLKARITMPCIYGLEMSEAAKGTISGFKSTYNFELELSDASSLNGYIDAGNVKFNLSEESQVALKGSGFGIELNGTDASKLDLAEFTLKSADVTLRKGSEAVMNVNGRFDVDLTEASKVLYLGNPVISDASISGGSIMRHQ